MEKIVHDFKTKNFKKCRFLAQSIKEVIFEDPHQDEPVKKLKPNFACYSYICTFLKKYEEPTVPEKTHFVSFHTEEDNFKRYGEFIAKKASEYFDTVSIYTPTILNDLGFTKHQKVYETTPIAGGYIISGFRPDIMLHELSKMNDGDLLFFRDINYEKYPKYINFENIIEVALECLETCGSDFFVPFCEQYNECEYTKKLVYRTKTNVLRELGENQPFSYEFPQIHAYIFIMRKSPETIEILTEWKNATDNDEWLDGKQYGDMHPLFCGQSLMDNSLLSVVIANRVRKNKLPEHYPSLYFVDRDIHKIRQYTDYSHLQFKNIY
jgi:hypothetical protein